MFTDKTPLSNISMNGHRDGLMNRRHRRIERSPVGEHFCLPDNDFISYDSVSSVFGKQFKVNRQSHNETRATVYVG